MQPSIENEKDMHYAEKFGAYVAHTIFLTL